MTAISDHVAQEVLAKVSVGTSYAAGSTTSSLATMHRSEVDFFFKNEEASGTDTVFIQFEVSPDGTNWAVVQSESSGTLSDLELTRAVGFGEYVQVTLAARGLYGRAKIKVSSGTADISCVAIRRKDN